MATVITDDKHYKGIAEKIREMAESEAVYKPDEMAAGVEAVHAKAYENGHTDGYTEGDLIGSEKGYKNGYTNGYNAGTADGAQSEYDRFWDAFQDGGNRTDYSWAFRFVSDYCAKPKYKVQNLATNSKVACMFQSSKITKLESKYFDLSSVSAITDEQTKNMYAVFNNCLKLVEIEDIGIPAMNYSATWYACSKLETIAVVRCASGKEFDDTYKPFYGCTSLKNVIFEGELDTNGLTLQYSPKLSRASIESVIGVLSTSTSGLKVTLSKAAVNKAFETSEGANNGVSSADWAALIATKSNWTISLV